LKTLAQELYSALSLRYQATISDAKARMRIYFEHPVGIGEHPQHLEEIDKLLDLISQAEDKKSALERHFEQHQKIGI
jgi:LmbE family N-acetylglucosaminyl deacetylase